MLLFKSKLYLISKNYNEASKNGFAKQKCRIRKRGGVDMLHL